MFSLRIHLLDSSVSSATSSEAAGSNTATLPQDPNPHQRFQIVRGIVHLYRKLAPPPTASYAVVASSSSSSPSATLPLQDSLLPPMRGKLLFVVAIADALSPDDLFGNDGMEDRYSVLIEFDDQIAADRFYLELNGWRFPSSDVAQKMIGKMTDSDEIRGGMLLPVTSPPTKGKKVSRSNKRRN